MIEELIGTARRLAAPNALSKARQSDLRRSISTAYYALFHALAKDGADLFVGASASRPNAAWAQTYRAVEHGFARNACTQVRGLGFPAPLVDCAETFVRLQQQRHVADYDPLAGSVGPARPGRTDQDEGALTYRPNFWNWIRFGINESAPRRRFLSSS